MRYNDKSRARPFRAAFWSLLLFFSILGAALVYLPESPLPNAWNPIKPLAVTDPVTPLTSWKLQQTANDPEACIAALQSVATITERSRFSTDNAQCYIETPVELRRVGRADMSGVRTDCSTALRLAMWEHHTLQPAARRQLGVEVARINDIGSYNCRAIRTVTGETGRMSSHATASAIDVSGFQFDDGRSAILTRDWNSTNNTAAFLRAVGREACDWFPLTLSPDYNDLHKDHFHLQASGWSLCR